MRVKELLREATTLLKAAGLASPRLDAEVLLSFVLGCERLALYKGPEQEVAAEKVALFRVLVARRAAGEPVAYLTGEKEFMGLKFKVTPAVLIPRPETELLVEKAIGLVKDIPAPVIVDVGTGSGAIVVSLAIYLPHARLYATDISPAALAVAEENAVHHGVAGRITFLLGDLLEPLLQETVRRVDLVVANLPYIPTPKISALPREVLREPVAALNGGPDGLVLYRRLVPQAFKLLVPGGYLLLEIGQGQGEAALGLFPPTKWEAHIELDLAGRERLVVARAVKRD